MINVYYTIYKMEEIIPQVAVVNKKMGPHLEHEPERTDLENVEQVLKDSSSSSTFLANMGASSVPRKSSVSTARIRELEKRLHHQEQ